MRWLCYFYIFYSLFSSKILDFVVSLYKGVVEFLPVPTCQTLAFFKSLSMLQTCFMFGTQSY